MKHNMTLWARMLFVGAFFMGLPMIGAAAEPPIVQLTYSINPNNTVTLTWSNAWAASCTATGDWSGAKATSGTENVGRLSGTKRYGMTCAGTKDDRARLSWEAPTQFVDGSPLPAGYIVGYEVYQGRTAETIALVERVTGLEQIKTNLEDGTHYFAVVSVGADNARSEFSAIASKTIAPAATANGEQVLRQPNPPTPVAVE